MINCKFENVNNALLRHVTVGVIVLDARKKKVLLVKRGLQLQNPNKWVFPGGFLSRDETTRECAVRETLEETGYKVKIERLFRINDNPLRPKEDRQNVDFCYIAVVGRKIGKPDSESSEVKWIDLNNLPKEKDWAYDHGETLHLYINWTHKHFQIPLLNE